MQSMADGPILHVGCRKPIVRNGTNYHPELFGRNSAIKNIKILQKDILKNKLE